jgi:hypothetical protein
LRDIPDQRNTCKGGIAVKPHRREESIGFGWIVLLVLLYVVLNPIPGPIDDAIVASVGGYQALK